MDRLILLVFTMCFFLVARGQPHFRDRAHQSSVFGKNKAYRVYLPQNYQKTTDKYPVIYFFHGWGGRYFMDPSAKLDYEKIGELVDKYQFILVMWDGSMDEAEPRPYNIGDHHDVRFHVQMADYFTELVAHIDSTYRTYTSRNQRGIIGFSMGGFMSFYIAGKYPDRISAAVNFVGSPDFFVGLPENHTHYPIKYTFENLRDVGLLFHNRTNCPMSGLNDEVHRRALWTGLKNYEYHKLEGEHQIDDPGETKIFESAVRFVTDRFEHPKPLGKRWSHYDLCPRFEVWDYSVKSNKNEPGFLFLKNVDELGFGFYTQKWLPDGPAIKGCKATVSTAPVYAPNSGYEIRIFHSKEKKMETMQLQSDAKGRLHIELAGDGCEVGISKKGQQPNFVVAGYQLQKSQQLLKVNETNELALQVFNRGGDAANKKDLKITLSCADSAVAIHEPVQSFKLKNEGGIFSTKPFRVECTKKPPSDGSPAWLRMEVTIEFDNLSFRDYFLLPVWYDVPAFENILVDDGRAVAPTKKQGDYFKAEMDSVYGTGNGDGTVSPSEQIMLYENGHRLRLYTDDPFVVVSEEIQIDEMLPGKWPDGFTLSSVVKIANDCPDGHIIEFLGHYETKTFMPIYRQVKWGKVKVKNSKP